MDSSNHYQEMVSVVIPALNEEGTIGPIVQAARSHPAVREVVVVDDGSTDQTAVVAETHGARVISLSANRGKAEAMSRGVAETGAPIIVFLDADLVGFTPRMLDRMIEKVLEGGYDMFVVVHDRGSRLFNLFNRQLPLISGLRALRRKVWQAVPEEYRRGYQIEIALNYFARENGFHRGLETMLGLRQLIKERKWGLFSGLSRRLAMMLDIGLIYFRLYFISSLGRSLRQGYST